jgi:hypothetical protein
MNTHLDTSESGFMSTQLNTNESGLMNTQLNTRSTMAENNITLIAFNIPLNLNRGHGEKTFHHKLHPSLMLNRSQIDSPP